MQPVYVTTLACSVFVFVLVSVDCADITGTASAAQPNASAIVVEKRFMICPPLVGFPVDYEEMRIRLVLSELGALTFAPSSTPIESRSTSSPPSQPENSASAPPTNDSVS